MADGQITQPEHTCKHEADLAVMAKTVEGMDKKLDKVVECIDGNGKPGIKTEIELNKQAIRRAWWWLGGVSLFLVGIAARSFLI